jgi:hypothetical protein
MQRLPYAVKDWSEVGDDAPPGLLRQPSAASAGNSDDHSPSLDSLPSLSGAQGLAKSWLAVI